MPCSVRRTGAWFRLPPRQASYCVPPMYRQGLADAMEKMCASRARREEMGQIGQRRVDAYFHHEQMLANYRKMYDETATEYHLE